LCAARRSPLTTRLREARIRRDGNLALRVSGDRARTGMLGELLLVETPVSTRKRGGQRLPDRPLADSDRPIHRRIGAAQPRECHVSLCFGGRRQQQDELVAAVAREEVTRAQIGAPPARKRREKTIAGGVAATVVDLLEAIEVDRRNR